MHKNPGSPASLPERFLCISCPHTSAYLTKFPPYIPWATYIPISHSCPTELLIHLPPWSLKCFHFFSMPLFFLRHMIHVLQPFASMLRHIMQYSKGQSSEFIPISSPTFIDVYSSLETVRDCVCLYIYI